MQTGPAAASIPRSGGPFQALGAFAVVAAALLDPFQAAIAVAGLVGIVLVDASMHPGPAGALLGVFRIDRRREYGIAGRCRRRCRGGFLRSFLGGLLGGLLGRLGF